MERYLSDCLPEAYRRLIDILIQKGYIECDFFLNSDYYVKEDGLVKGTKFHKYRVDHLIEKTERKLRKLLK